ncbi:AraC family transcriptional regulator [Chondromyces apiculatus]|uniref:Transcriptional regulator, AraC family n=1 Tax=Chondromyces apiculatus DSM 436 TaxID=1192034 RepID=A0A017TIP8_9BACT|nr:AraC family transcriptional regulator [Chondromyces apiculatus]EYF08777.1 Transcriptional regulator, AraC family [Chondromyces apiculatus DSM 436]
MADLPNLANLDYVHRVNRAIDHITRNLADPLPLEELARIACFSPFHFHRVFRALVGETLHVFVKRLRLERAVQWMWYRPSASLTEIALAVGFASSSDFSRSFRAHFGVPPSVFDVEAYRRRRRDQMIDTLVPDARHRLARLPAGANPDHFTPRIRDLPKRRVAYIRALEPYTSQGVPDAVARLTAWARPRGLAGGQWLGYQWEDPEVVALEQCRYDVGLEIPPATPVDAPGINVTTFPPMEVVELDLSGGIELEMRALDWLYKTWLPTSGYVPDHQPGFEAFLGEPFAHGSEHFELRVQIPIVDAATSL